jgi:hypothetical protein
MCRLRAPTVCRRRKRQKPDSPGRHLALPQLVNRTGKNRSRSGSHCLRPRSSSATSRSPIWRPCWWRVTPLADFGNKTCRLVFTQNRGRIPGVQTVQVHVVVVSKVGYDGLPISARRKGSALSNSLERKPPRPVVSGEWAFGSVSDDGVVVPHI